MALSVPASKKRVRADPEEAQRKKAAHNDARKSLVDYKGDQNVYRIMASAHSLAKVLCLVNTPYLDKQSQIALPENAIAAARQVLGVAPEVAVPLDEGTGAWVRHYYCVWNVG